jgi:hypothetical protein
MAAIMEELLGRLRRELEEQEVGVKWPPYCVDVRAREGERPLIKTQQTEKTQYVL